jgi:hypothetical protein
LNQDLPALTNPFGTSESHLSTSGVRAILSDHFGKEPFGKMVPANLTELIEKVYVSPTSAIWFKDLVQDVMSKHEIKKSYAFPI